NAMVLFAAEKLRRPVKWTNDRAGSFQSDAHARDLCSRVKVGFDAQHKIVALEVDTTANLGAYLSTNGSLIPTVPTAAVLGGAYAVPAVYMPVRAAYTNTAPVDAYRGAARPESISLPERAIEAAS